MPLLFQMLKNICDVALFNLCWKKFFSNNYYPYKEKVPMYIKKERKEIKSLKRKGEENFVLAASLVNLPNKGKSKKKKKTAKRRRTILYFRPASSTIS